MSSPLSLAHYYLVECFQSIGDPRSMGEYWIARHGMLPCAVIIATYLAFCLYIGPKLMENRKAFELRYPMLAYNFIMSAWNLRFFLLSLVVFDFGRKFFDFRVPDKNDRSAEAMLLIRLGNEYLLSKYCDFIDTIFFVLRRKQSHISFLHLYHHSLVAGLGTMFYVLYPTSPIVGVFCLLNSAVHVIMYGYYGLAALGPRVRPYLWWKRYITQLQIAQFGIFIVYALTVIRKQEGYPPLFINFGAAQAPVFGYLFVQFYRRTYLSPEKSAAKLNGSSTEVQNGHQAVEKSKLN